MAGKQAIGIVEGDAPSPAPAVAASPAPERQTRYRYFVSRSLHMKEGPGIRVPAREIEKLVASRLAELLADPIEFIATAWLDVPADRLESLHQRCFDAAGRLRGLGRETVTALVRQVRVGEHGVEVDCRTAALASRLDARCHADALETVTLTADVRLTHSGMALKLVQADGSAVAATPHALLVKRLLNARGWWAELRQGEIDIARLAFLSPEVVTAMLAGRPRAGVDVGKPTLGAPLPACWREQKRVLLPG